MEDEKIQIFDSTLRDGAQGENVNFTVEDKLNIARELDRFGVDYIEAGNPGSNPKDMEFFLRAKEKPFTHARLVAFGSTRRKNVLASEDNNVRALLTADTEVVCIFGKSWDLHVTDILHATLQQNLEMIADTISYLKAQGREVMFDAEHFFDGYKANPDYALQTLRTAQEAGASAVVLCDTNGGCFPDEVEAITRAATGAVSVCVGIHCHNDAGCAVANSICAVRAGARQVQGTFIGIGERCGNTNLSTVIGDLQLKRRCRCVPQEQMVQLTKTARFIADIANIPLTAGMPFVGRSAFAHKAGMHVDGVLKNSASFEHVPPESVGNKRNVLISEVAGRTALLSRINEVAPDLTKDSPETSQLMDLLKRLEYDGYQFEAATASFELIVLRHLSRLRNFFSLENFKIIGEQSTAELRNRSSAMVKVRVGERYEITADEGEGPVHALDRALRKALEVFYPSLKDVKLIDYKVRVLDGKDATASKVRVLIESTDGEAVWRTVGVSADIINASLIALVDAIQYKLTRYDAQSDVRLD